MLLGNGPFDSSAAAFEGIPHPLQVLSRVSAVYVRSMLMEQKQHQQHSELLSLFQSAL